jgi:Tfp pilus assembly protein PilX
MRTIARAKQGGARAAHRVLPPFRQRGVSLFFALSALVGLSLAGVAMMRTADTSTLVVGNIGFHEAAVQSTDLALEAAVTTLSTFAKTTASYSDVSANGYYASVANTLEPASSRLSASAGNLISDSATGNTLRYVIERMCGATGAPNVTNCLMEDSASPVFRVTTLVIGPRNTSEVVQHYVTAGGFTAQCAILTQESVSFGGQVNITGSGNCVHSNTNVSFTNSPNSAVGAVYASGTISGNVTGAGGTENPGVPQIGIPEINPTPYRQYADYVFNADGKIYNRTGALVQDTLVSGAWFGWSRTSTSPVVWSKSDNIPSPEGTYFFEGNVNSSSNAGTSGSPWRISFFATGAIRLSAGTATFDDYKGTDLTVPQGVKDVFLMAGGDIYFRGSFSPTALPGAIMTNEEYDVAGSSGFNGNIIARNSNATDPASMVNHVNSNSFQGTMSVNYNPNTMTSLFNSNPIRRQWRTAER